MLANYVPIRCVNPGPPTGFCTLWDVDSQLGSLAPRQNKIRSFENMVMSPFQQTRPEAGIESLYTKGRKRKIDSFGVVGFFCIPTLC